MLVVLHCRKKIVLWLIQILVGNPKSVAYQKRSKKYWYLIKTPILCLFVNSYKLYYALIYPFLIYGIITWGNTDLTTIQPLSVLQKKAVHIMTFSKFDEHSSPIFKKLNIIKISDLIKYHISIFTFKFHNQLLPSVFNSYFTSVENIHSYNTRATAKVLSSSKSKD